MNKTCSRCQKTVYPIEELKCLDKIWHKTCFKCTECGMALNMKTYKGFNKMPYCEAHIPKAKATTIADTPELKRLAENTKLQSNVKYHADFEKSKGKFTQVADDPETLRIKANSKIISNVAYHGDLEKKAAMERQREVSELVENRDELEYFSETLAAEQFSQYAPQSSTTTIITQSSLMPEQLSPPLPSPQQQHQQYHQSQQQKQQHQQLHYQQQPPYHSQSQVIYSDTQILQYHQQPPTPVQHQAQNTAAIVSSNQMATNSHAYNNSQNQMQQQHYQQPQPIRQPQQQQQQQQYQQQLQPAKQTSHLYPSGDSQGYQRQNTAASQITMNNGSGGANTNGGNNYTQLRSAILQSAHHPTGTREQAALKASQTTTNYQQYDPYESNYARPTAAASTGGVGGGGGGAANNSSGGGSALYPARNAISNNNNGHNNSSNANNNNAAYQQHQRYIQQQQHQQQQQQKQQQQQQQQQMYYNNSNASQQQQQQLHYHSNGVAGGGSSGSGGSGSGNVNVNLSNFNNTMQTNNIGKIADYDPLTDGPRQMPNTSRSSTTLIYSSDSTRAGTGNIGYQKQTRIGSVHDMDPENGVFGSIAVDNNAHHQKQYQQSQQQQQQHQHQNKQHQQQQQQQANTIGNHVPNQQSHKKMAIYRALYDYEAQDVDEVSFREGDIIYEVESIDSGWMTGRVNRTGAVGMLPANYVEKAVI